MLRVSSSSAVHLLSFTSITLATRAFFHSATKQICQRMAYTIEEHGSEYSENYRVFIRDQSGIVSPFHDIPLFADKENNVFNMVVEVPRWSNAKMEISTKELMNPIKQDIKKSKLRFVKNVFPFKGYPWNYGAIPQTWEDPCEHDELTGLKGDGDPIDVVDIGNKVARRGEVKPVKLLGVMALIDEGETDWKVIAIDVTDPLAPELNDIDDVRKLMPGLIEATHEWFKIYKIPAGSHPNHFAFNGEAKNRTFTTDVVMQTHAQWKKLVDKKIEHDKHNLTWFVLKLDLYLPANQNIPTYVTVCTSSSPANIIEMICQRYDSVDC
ncbi:uncharacterized protein LOC130647101 isoform X2 [Hydractinia symbiolongicarpus]|uniref:uncharacterized protein LOC130647101 isoform X2 n=1 Tax=Hydractinia symbiolongicarpus TaxID=13093 RepID=UPI00254FFAC3|nr:uncharacterized protein LOC130647101 isoform X2 [Hydractinia symbiolongicarpus]